MRRDALACPLFLLSTAPSPAKQLCVLACKAGEANACCWAQHVGEGILLIGHRRKFITPRAAKLLFSPTAQGYFTTNCVPPKRRASSNACAPCCAGTCSTVCHSQASASRLAVGWQAGAGQPQTRSYTAILLPVPLLACRTEQFVQVGEANL